MKQDRKDRKERLRNLQQNIRDSLPFPVPHAPRLHLVRCKYGPRQKPQLPKPEWDAWTSRDLETIPHNSTITHAAIPNPNYVSDADIPQYAAIRFANCVSAEKRKALLDRVELMRSVCIQSKPHCRPRTEKFEAQIALQNNGSPWTGLPTGLVRHLDEVPIRPLCLR